MQYSPYFWLFFAAYFDRCAKENAELREKIDTLEIECEEWEVTCKDLLNNFKICSEEKAALEEKLYGKKDVETSEDDIPF